MRRQAQSPRGNPPSLLGKRTRTEAIQTFEEESTATRTRSHPAQRPRTRATVACSVCRARKTRCDGRQPVCGYCASTGSTCQYDIADASTDRSLCHDMGVQILHAIEQLTQLVKDQPPQTITNNISNHQGPIPSSSLNEPIQNVPVPASPHEGKFSEGLDSIFGWHVFQPGLDSIPVDDGRPIPMPDELPPIKFSELSRFQSNYCRVVHNVNPILDLTTLDQYVSHIAENGFDWTTRTCLVALVCAIGALCQDKTTETPSSPPTADPNDDVMVAYRFWSVACKRLGRAMCQNTLESAQCLCLAGKSTLSARSPSSQPISSAIEHSIFYTTYKSEVEVRYELAIPGSVLEHIEDQLVFPSPPTPDNSQLSNLDNETITWYYYLADIAARHLINRIIKVRVKVDDTPNEAQARAMLHDYKLFGSQLEDWYKSLPSDISFPPPSSSITFEPNQLIRILRSRYLCIRELLCRPFVRICLNSSLNLPAELVDEIASVASEGLQYCAWRLQAMCSMDRLDHGLWIWVRNNTACSLILIGAARSYKFPSLNAASRMWVPDNWHDVIMSFLNGLEIFSKETRGGVSDCYKLICRNIEEFHDS
ncbi:uncharacterized protein N7496_000310 [Penicillium cataractarum]|uniref:Zn(2)-C6 fungal-type domain-containing protein n=1 Tax=Penicillium cataractarum TaxID=2100454 RepID=A0A9X0B5Z1_9EURO|nr:uncharacterized protein N7496_000310 [Penicillium cataractarum]KAJ5389242.1 hypothetical protein N7496_000310 [Penicillium cataractarum]